MLFVSAFYNYFAIDYQSNNKFNVHIKQVAGTYYLYLLATKCQFFKTIWTPSGQYPPPNFIVGGANAPPQVRVRRHCSCRVNIFML